MKCDNIILVITYNIIANPLKREKESIKYDKPMDYNKLITGKALYIGPNSLTYTVPLPKQKIHGYYPCPNMWFIVRYITKMESDSDETVNPTDSTKPTMVVLQRHPYDIKICDLFDEDMSYNKMVYMDKDYKLYWKMQDDQEVQHYATLNILNKSIPESITPNDPTMDDYYNYIECYKSHNAYKNVQYQPANVEGKWMDVTESYEEWKNALFKCKLDTYVPTTCHYNTTASVG